MEEAELPLLYCLWIFVLTTCLPLLGVSIYHLDRMNNGSPNSPWAIKKVNKRFANGDFADRISKEAELLKSFKHPNIVGFRGFTRTEDGREVLAMEECTVSLGDMIEDRMEEDMGPFSPKEIVQITDAIASALYYLHTEKNLIHGDMKSHNILIKGDFNEVKLCDFGVSVKIEADGIGKIEDYVGTSCWSAPETLADGPLTAKSDIFSLGLVLWEMLALTPPHIAPLSDSDASLCVSLNEEQYGTRPALPVIDLGPEYDKIIDIFNCCTEADYKKRPTALEILKKLDNWTYEVAKTTGTLTKVWQYPEVKNFLGRSGDILGIFVHSECVTNKSSLFQQASSHHLLGNSYMWLMWNWTVEDLTNVDLKLDTNMKLISKDNRITEVYKIKPSSSIISYHLQPPYYKSPHRYNHQGESVNITLVSSKAVGLLRENESFDSLADKTLHPEAISSLGVVYFLSRPLLETFNCTFDVHKSKGWGVKTSKGWTDMMGLLERGECEFTLTLSHLRKDRSESSPFIQEIMIAKVVFAFQEISGFGKWDAIIVPFELQTWTCVASAMLIFGCALCLFMKATSHPDLVLPTVIELISSSLAQQGGIELKKSLISVQLFIFTLMTFTFMVFTYYCSQVLNSFLSSSGFSINSLQQLLDSNYKFGIQNSQYLKNLRQGEITWIGPRDAMVNKILDKVEKEDKTHWLFPECHPLIRDGKLALMAGDNSMFEYMKAAFTEREICLTQTIIKANNLHSLYFAKHSPYINFLRIKFAWMKEVGLLKRAVDIFLTKKPECLYQVEAVSISFKGTMLVFSFLVGSFLLSILILIGERLLKSQNNL